MYKRRTICALIAAILALPGNACNSQAQDPGRGVYYIDRDGDGYGVASPLGPDADDNDPEVNTSATFQKKYPDLGEFLKKQDYEAQRIFYISRQGDDRQGLVNDPQKPYATFGYVRGLLRPGDAVIFFEGTYKGKYILGLSKLRGTEQMPIVLMAYPGQKVVLDSTQQAIGGMYSRHLIIDGFVAANSEGWHGEGIGVRFCRNIVFRNIESTGFTRGLIGMQDLHDILIENCVFHANASSHGIYLGARDKPNSNITVRNCISYRNGRHGIQHNGRIKNLVVEDSVIHSNNLAGIALIEGVSDSVIRNNLVFNNNKQGVIFYTYDDRSPAIQPYDQNNNLVENNIIWIGRFSWNGKNQPELHAAIQFKDSTSAQKISMENNTIRANTIVSQQGEVFSFNREDFARNNKIEDNLLFRTSGPDKVMTCLEQDYSFEAFEAFSSQIGRNSFAQPQFADVSDDYFITPELFDFSYPKTRR